MTQELYQKAMKFAGEKHKDQKYPGTNINYLLHISNVAMEVLLAHTSENNFDINFAIQAAILHDTIEDTNTNFEEIKNEFGERIAKAVAALSKDKTLSTKEEQMTDSLNRINQLEKEVGIVKLADRISNLQGPPKHWSKEKIIRYHTEAKAISKSLKDKNEYLNNRLEQKIDEYKISIEA
ncbi:HD domain-containing protein [Aquimarina aquimarini]|uniref:HD domain-containing protein n=1 Tax=Aquimarina aquimarini TaxID=1191734 RepID=UPI000D552AD4|nr:HD domain-containing protein [Aquimarina aquimarini]